MSAVDRSPPTTRTENLGAPAAPESLLSARDRHADVGRRDSNPVEPGSSARLRDALPVVALAAANLLGAAAFLWPFLLPSVARGISEPHAADAAWILVVLLGFLGFVLFAQLGRLGLGPKTVALVGVLGAAMVTLRLPGFVAGFSAMFIVVILAGNSFGPAFGFLLGAVGTFASGLFVGGLGPWLPFQMVAVGWVGAGAGLMPRSTRWSLRLGLLALYGAVVAFAFGGLMNLWFWPFAAGSSAVGWSPEVGMADNLARYGRFYLLTSATWDLFGAIGNPVLVLVLGRPVLASLDRAARRMRLDLRTTRRGARACDPSGAVDRGGIMVTRSRSGGRGPRKRAEESPDSTGQSAGEIPGGATRGKCHRKQTAGDVTRVRLG